MSSPDYSDISNVVGSIEKCNFTAKREYHHCCAWKIKNIFSKISKGDQLKSPLFTIPNREQCKWYLSLQSIYKCKDATESDCIYFVCLVLDHEQSDCTEVVAKFNLTILKKQQTHECNLESMKTFNFVAKSEKSAGILSLIQENELEVFRGYYYLKIICDVFIEHVVPKNHNNLSRELGIILENQFLTDVVLSVNGKDYPAHKMILAARSSVFAAMFAHDMVENRGVVLIKDMDGDIVEEMLRYIYTDKVEKLDLASDLLIAADKYDLKGLRIECEGFLIKTLSSSNVFDLLFLAESCTAKNLKSEAMNFILISTQLMKTAAWDRICLSNPKLLREIAEVVLNSKFITDFEYKI